MTSDSCAVIVMSLVLALLQTATAAAQMRPELRPDEAPWAWLDAGNRFSVGGAFEYEFDEAFGFDLETGYVTEIGERGLYYVALTGTFDPPEVRYFLEAELEVGHDFAEDEFVWQALARFGGLPRVADRSLAVWFDAGWSSLPGVVALLGLDVPVFSESTTARTNVGGHLFSVAEVHTDGAAFAAAEVGWQWGARLSWFAYPHGRLELALSAFAEHIWMRERNYEMETTVVVLLSLRWYPMWERDE